MTQSLAPDWAVNVIKVMTLMMIQMETTIILDMVQEVVVSEMQTWALGAELRGKGSGGSATHHGVETMRKGMLGEEAPYPILEGWT